MRLNGARIGHQLAPTVRAGGDMVVNFRVRLIAEFVVGLDQAVEQISVLLARARHGAPPGYTVASG